MEKIISMVNKVHSHLKKLHKKNRRNKELQQVLEKARSAAENNLTAKIEEYHSDKPHVESVRKFGKIYLDGYNKTEWNMALSVISGIKSEKFIPEDIFASFIEPRLNNVAHIPGFEEKNMYDLLFHDIHRPKTLIRYINEDYYDASYRLISKEEAAHIVAIDDGRKILKPALEGQGQGRGIKIVEPGNEDEIMSSISRCSSRRPSFVVEQWIDQHPVLANLYSGSVNTLKMITLRLSGAIVYLMSRLNIGREGRLIDKEGYFAGVSEQGYITAVIDTRNFTHAELHESSGAEFIGTQIPSFDEAVVMCKKAHRHLLHFDMASWDVAIDYGGRPLLIEVNNRSQAIGYHQMVNGPLFGKYTEELLSKFKS